MCLARHSNKLSTNCAGRLGSPYLYHYGGSMVRKTDELRKATNGDLVVVWGGGGPP